MFFVWFLVVCGTAALVGGLAICLGMMSKAREKAEVEALWN